MGDYGLKISQPFYDVTSAADDKMIFSSAWPTLPIAAETTLVSSSYGGTSDFTNAGLSFSHNLGFVPFTITWATVASTGKTYRYFSGPTTFQPVSFDKTNVYVNPSTDWSSIHVVCYNIDIATDVEYPYIKTSGATALYDDSFGIKIAKDGKDITSNDMRDFILHSRCQSPQVLAIKTLKSPGSGALTTFSYTPTVSSPLWAFGYAGSSSGSYYWVAPYNQSPPKFVIIANTDGTYTYTISYLPAGVSFLSLVILRDPMFSSNSLAVSY